jgi:hypothetical protein
VSRNWLGETKVPALTYSSSRSNRSTTVGQTLVKHSKASHHHTPAIERAVPIERIVELFSSRFDDPYLNPSAELSFEDLASGFPDLPREELEEALTHWTSHSGEKMLQTKTVEEGVEDSRVWYIHGLARHVS